MSSCPSVSVTACSAHASVLMSMRGSVAESARISRKKCMELGFAGSVALRSSSWQRSSGRQKGGCKTLCDESFFGALKNTSPNANRYALVLAILSAVEYAGLWG